MKKLLFISALFILCSVCKAQTQYIYNAYNKGAYILLVDSTHKDSFAYPKNTLIASLNGGARPQLTLSSVYSVSQGYGTGYAMVVATWDNSNIYILAPTVDSGFNKLNNMIFNDTFVLANYMKYADTLLPNPTIASYKQLLSSTFWTSSSGNLYPKNLSLNVGVGTSTPQGVLDVQASPSGFFRMTSDGVLHYNYNDEFFQLDGNNRRFQIGDLTYDWYGTSIDINDNAANQSINLRANNGVTINNLAGNGSGVAGVDNTGLLSWQNPYTVIDTITKIATKKDLQAYEPITLVQAIDTFTATNLQTSFTIAHSPLGRVVMTKNGVTQDYGTDYTESGTTITVTVPVTLAAKVQFIYIHQ